MAKTFEELASGEMDALYQGALFLSGGDAEAAEQLVVDTVMLAFEEHAAETTPEQTRRWFEARLVRSFLRRVRAAASGIPPRNPRVDSIDIESFDGLGPDELFRAAARLPPGPRAALWLVLLRRWGHAEAAGAMQIDATHLESMLGYRDVLMRTLLGSRPRRRESGGHA